MCRTNKVVQGIVRLTRGLHMGAKFPLISQDLPGPAALGPGDCNQQAVSTPEIMKG